MILQLPTPHPGQLQVLESDAKYKILMCGRRWGKSLISQLISLQAIFNGERVAYVTPTNASCKRFHRDILNIIAPCMNKLYGKEVNNYFTSHGTDLNIKIKNGDHWGILEFFSGEPEM